MLHITLAKNRSKNKEDSDLALDSDPSVSSNGCQRGPHEIEDSLFFNSSSGGASAVLETCNSPTFIGETDSCSYQDE